jgi:hypothetical protein
LQIYEIVCLNKDGKLKRDEMNFRWCQHLLVCFDATYAEIDEIVAILVTLADLASRI